ncbi:uncharacterized protein A4U43_C02F350 [Asparagus officinalis]|uniref:Uncharacterized protein n=1 Tax=Asparagus officinalis TaxID=4686 RepID=A0A5P1FEQ0_ASPOF|nr:uncharacterized protein A4U43_C02F350 [Asparagus officinalis]
MRWQEDTSKAAHKSLAAIENRLVTRKDKRQLRWEEKEKETKDDLELNLHLPPHLHIISNPMLYNSKPHQCAGNDDFRREAKTKTKEGGTRQKDVAHESSQRQRRG